jgi:hypothetical protein
MARVQMRQCDECKTPMPLERKYFNLVHIQLTVWQDIEMLANHEFDQLEFCSATCFIKKIQHMVESANGHSA